MLEKVEENKMNKREIEERIEKAQAELEEAKKMLENYKEEKENWKPKYGECYWYVNTSNDIYTGCWNNDETDKCRYDTNNCFKTEEKAEHRAELLETERQLMKYAREHNENIDWENFEQDKYYLYYDIECEKIKINDMCCYKRPRTVYFSSKHLAEQAIEEIGEDKIEAYCKEL